MKRKVYLLLLLIFALLLCSCGKAQDDPVSLAVDFLGYTEAEVLAWANENNAAEQFSFVYGSNTDVEVILGQVIDQSVAPGNPITDGIQITVYARTMLQTDPSSPKTVVPNVVGKSFDDAKTALSAVGLTVDFRYEASSREKDTVLSSEPLPGVSVVPGSKIVLILSSGESKAKQLGVKLDLPTTSSGQNTVQVYVDGELDRSKTVCLDGSVSSKMFYFTGSGVIDVRFMINGEFGPSYTLDFTSGKATKNN